MPELRREVRLLESVEDNVGIFLVRGTRDMLIPKRHFRICQEKLKETEVKEYKGMGRAIGGVELRDLCTWFERVIPPLILIPRAT